MDQMDFSAIRHRVKLLEDTGRSRLFENRDAVACPVCGQPFDQALVSRNDTEQLAPDAELSLCLHRGTDRMVVFTHADDS
ncbi:flagella cluster protein [Halobacterium salinarum]|uniref:Uncharacterized protein n=1 Tax=Halobacterium salinarum (strain ATCC 33171 / DSM 3754 / JCM 8978 / NBRC 102687 / NCIMB 764 / 91-R6) TaxID=2597657 RepID=A0A4D6GT00_HALS9|nr:MULTISPECIES: flagella cluster protein [Halobacterium]MCF2166478.1 flagella cluster protein [Halobacterium salinarum]MCF2168357.1 flagella cluster protein [Halobacterium salinarum]MDL0138249.1 flagella cluster protein [Halobacterium salinarum]QCC44803.1 uncharacterized protein HBSAL_05670 [Halobacterium salinarum]QRY23422.1 flagella cluster protein [Halobacterium sp. GSL-19]